MDYLFKKGSVGVRKMRDSICDYVFLADWLSTSSFTDDNESDLEYVLKNYNPKHMGEKGIMPCIIEYDGIAVGYIQYNSIRNSEDEVFNNYIIDNYKKPFGIKILISKNEHQNKGIGTEAVKGMLKYLIDEENADVIFVESKANNEKAIHCYEKSGFSKVETIDNIDDSNSSKIILMAKAS